MNFISDACRVQETRLAAAEAQDIRLKPKLAQVCVCVCGGGGVAWLACPDNAAPGPPNHPQACGRERAAFCGDAKPGRARVVKCLIERMGEPTFGAECREGLRERAAALTSDYR